MKEEIVKYVGRQIKYYRTLNKLTQKDLGERLGVKHNTISSYENGTNEVEQDMLFTLANIFHVSINDFFPSTEVKSVYERKAPYNVDEGTYDYIPLPVSAGELSTIDGTEPEEIQVPNIIMGKYAGNKDIFFMKVNGQSMNKIIPHDSMIAVKRIEITELQNDDIVVFSNGHEYSVKRYYNDVENKRFMFYSESTERGFVDHPIDYEHVDELVIHGKVVMYVVSTD